MQCDRAQDLVSRRLDGVLDGSERAGLAAHLATCRSCEAMARDLERTKRDIQALRREPAPVGLKMRIRDALDQAEPQEAAAQFPVLRLQGSIPLPRAAAAVVLACVFSSAISIWLWSMSDARARMEHDVVTAHVRSLIDNPIHVASADTHTVKPWFAGRVDVSPVVRDLSAEGFVLVGGRLDYVDGRRVAVVVYKQRQHVINIFTWPASTVRPPYASIRNGYNLLTWTVNGVTYYAISDLNLAELERLRILL